MKNVKIKINDNKSFKNILLWEYSHFKKEIEIRLSFKRNHNILNVKEREKSLQKLLSGISRNGIRDIFKEIKYLLKGVKEKGYHEIKLKYKNDTFHYFGEIYIEKCSPDNYKLHGLLIDVLALKKIITQLKVNGQSGNLGEKIEHKINTPISTILMNTQMISDTIESIKFPNKSTIVTQLARINRSIREIESMVNHSYELDD
ncbi:MAG: hypothetical protein RI575_05810 [Balneolaceae bacterium]|nr:hypothetical protein [Balneolaceae bacterium]MDR9408752.1 hypothetical protein [Balneolaceae bacterium]